MPSASVPTMYTPNRPRSGMVPPEVTASRWAPGRPVDGAGVPVPDDAGPQFGEFVGGVAPGQQVQGGLEGGAGQGGERARSAGRWRTIPRRRCCPGRWRRRSAGPGCPAGWPGHMSRSILPASIRSTVTAVCTRSARCLGNEDALGDLAHLVAGAAHPLQPAGHRRRRLDLDHQVHGAHVDAELQAGGGHHAAQPAGLEVVLDQGALVLGHGAVVGPGQHRIGARACCRPGPSCAPASPSGRRADGAEVRPPTGARRRHGSAPACQHPPAMSWRSA